MNLVHIQPWDVHRYTAAELMQSAQIADALLKRGPLG